MPQARVEKLEGTWGIQIQVLGFYSQSNQRIYGVHFFPWQDTEQGFSEIFHGTLLRKNDNFDQDIPPLSKNDQALLTFRRQGQFLHQDQQIDGIHIHCPYKSPGKTIFTFYRESPFYVAVIEAGDWDHRADPKVLGMLGQYDKPPQKKRGMNHR